MLALVADIGGTNARFALTDLSLATATRQTSLATATRQTSLATATRQICIAAPTLTHEKSLPTAEFASLQHAAEHYLQSVQTRPTHAAFAVASPVSGDEIRLTNRAWSFSRSELQAALKLEQLQVLNDFGAVAHAIPALTPNDRITLHGDANATLAGPVSVIGPGTGLGVALLVAVDSQSATEGTQDWRVVETEGGHVSFAPQNDEEKVIERWLSARFGRTSNERILCGAGISHMDAALSGAEHPSFTSASSLRAAADIVTAALDGHDLSSRKTLARFCAVLGSVAGDTALIHGARSVVIAGGIVPRFIPFLRTSAFRERFLAKGRFAAYLESVAIHVITHPNPGLLGAAVALRGANR
jgi:glucokinase